MDFILDVYVGWCLFFCFSLEIGCTGMKSEILSIKIKCIKNREKEKWKMKDKIFGVLQRIGRSFMLPIAILPVAGLLLGIGSSFTNETTIATYGLQKILGDGTVLHALLTIMNKVGSAVFDNLPLIFAVGVAIGMAKKEKEVSALSALIAYFVMNVAINGMLVVNGEITADGEIAKNVLEGTVASVCGIQSLQMGVFGGIIVGLGVAALHNRFHKIVLPNALSFFGGSRFVPIISTIVYMFVGIGMYFIWPPVQNLRFGWSGHRKRICGNVDFRYYQTCADPIWTASCILYAVLADCRGRQHGSCRTDGTGRSEYLLCPAGGFGQCSAFQRRCDQIFFR